MSDLVQYAVDHNLDGIVVNDLFYDCRQISAKNQQFEKAS